MSGLLMCIAIAQAEALQEVIWAQTVCTAFGSQGGQ